MSDLQVGLLVLGLLLIAGVMSYNWWQQRRWQKQVEMPEHDATPTAVPTLTPLAHDAEQRIEPHFQGQRAAIEDESSAELTTAGLDGRLDVVMEVRAEAAIASIALKALGVAFSSSPKQVQLSGFNSRAREWEMLAADPGAEYTMVRAAMQLVDRSGPVTQQQLEEFIAFVSDFASTNQAIVDSPDIQVELERAADLDDFCAEVDVVVGINVVAPTGQFFHGSKIRSLAEGMGLRSQVSGGFHCVADDNSLLFTLDNQEHKAFLPEQIRNMTTNGITFLLDVPRTADGLRVFDRMLTIAKSCADSLDGILADDNRVTLTEAGLDKIRDQLRNIYAAMNGRGIAPGSPLALRLFS